VKIVLLSTYELGRQPFGLASPAAWLRKRGHEVACLDLSRQELDEAAVTAAELIAVYLPMHTATRLAARLIPRLRGANPQAHLCGYGLYAPMNEEYLRSLGVESVLGGEFEGLLVELAARLESSRKEEPEFSQGLKSPCDNSEAEGFLATRADMRFANEGQSRPAPLGMTIAHAKRDTTQFEAKVSVERLSFEVPDRAGLPAMEKYAHLVMPADGYRIVGSTEASRGCKHLCRHCPIVPVYKGVFRIVQRDVVMEDVRRQVAAGAQHISFGDPDFFNGIKHALELVEEFHREFPRVSYDVTIKIEHLRKYEQHLSRLKETGCLFVISAVESVDDEVLGALDKGHTRADFLHVARAFREREMTLHPTFVPFTPWTTTASYLELLQTVYEEGLVENVSPIQLGIRLLIPEGSRMLELEEIRTSVGAFDAESLAYPWKNGDAQLDALSETVQAIAAEADRQKLSRFAAFERIWKAAYEAAGIEASELTQPEAAPVPFLSEPWYCCAEPTKDQLVSIGTPAPRVRGAAASAAGAADFV
jgi:radical SAM superfamily enzyme YgiQ (UPF0313 family)